MMLFGPWTPLQDACFWRKPLYEKVGGINGIYRYAADYDFFLRAAWEGRSAYTPAVFSAFRKHEGQKSISGAAQYKAEQRSIQQCMRGVLGISKAKTMLLWPSCWFYVRFRHYLGRRFFRHWVVPGSSALLASVSRPST
jgi:hypothetical protein